MLKLWGVPVWAFPLYVAVVAFTTWRRVRGGAVGGLLSVSLLVAATTTECAAFLVMASPQLGSVLGFQLMGSLTLSSWLLETWAKRAKTARKLRVVTRGAFDRRD